MATKATLGILIVCLAAILAGCGSSGGDSAAGAGGTAATGGSFVDWPMFGRVPARTHYLPAEEKALDPPLKQAWSVNTHALIEFPPAIHGGVAYVINKYGNGKAVRLRDRKVLWEINIRPSDKGKPNFVTAPVYYRGAVYGAFLSGHLAAGDAATGRKLWVRKFDAHLESSPLAIDGTLYLGTDTTNLIALRASDGKTRWQLQRAGRRSKPAPATTTARSSSPTTRARCSRSTPTAASPSGAATRARSRPTAAAASSPPPPSPSAASTPPATTAPSTPSTRRPARSSGTSTTGDHVYGSPAVAQVPGTPPTVYIGAENGRFFALDARTGKERWHYDVGGPIPGTATVIGHTVYTSSFKTQETTGLDVRTHKRTFHLKAGRLHADGLRRRAPLPGRLLRPDRPRTALAEPNAEVRGSGCGRGSRRARRS